MSRMTIPPLVVAALLLASPGAFSRQQFTTGDDSVTVYFALISMHFPAWVASFRAIDTAFGADLFKMHYDRLYWNHPHPRPFDFTKGMSARDSIFFEFSPDSLRVVDINAFAEVVNSEKVRRIAFDVDAAVVVGDIPGGILYHIDFGGPQTGLLEARWVDNDRILLVGHDYVDYFPDCVPFFTLYDLNTRATVRFRSTKVYPCVRRPYVTNVDRRMEMMKVLR